jgi:hypothetical protein
VCSAANKLLPAGRLRVQPLQRAEAAGLVVAVGALEQRQLRPVLQVRPPPALGIAAGQWIDLLRE